MDADKRKELANPAIRDGLVMVTGASDLHSLPLLTFDARALLTQLRRTRDGQSLPSTAAGAGAGAVGGGEHEALAQHASATVADALADALDYMVRLVPFARRAHGFAALADLSRLAHEPEPEPKLKKKEKHKSRTRPRRQESAVDTLQSVFSLLLSSLDTLEVRSVRSIVHQ